MRLYDEFAEWWPLLSAPADYAEEAAFFLRLLRENAGTIDALLELGSGGGNTASHLVEHARLTLVEPAAGMRAVSQRLVPIAEHLAGDMRDVRLDRTFDAVLLHDAVSYMQTLTDVRRAARTAFAHCRAGGVAVFAPDELREGFEPGTSHGGHDSSDGSRGLRYLEWRRPHASDPTRYVVDYAFVLRRGDDVTVEHDRHVLGLFAANEWLEVLREVGFAAEAAPFEHSEFAAGERVVFVGRRP